MNVPSQDGPFAAHGLLPVPEAALVLLGNLALGVRDLPLAFPDRKREPSLVYQPICGAEKQTGCLWKVLPDSLDRPGKGL